MKKPELDAMHRALTPREAYNVAQFYVSTGERMSEKEWRGYNKWWRVLRRRVNTVENRNFIYGVFSVYVGIIISELWKAFM